MSQQVKVYRKLEVGTSASKITLAAGIPAADVHTTTAATSGNSIALEINHTRTVDSASGRDWGVKVTMTSADDVKFPGGVNAVYGSLALGSGGVHGRAAGIQGELVMPDAQLTRGTFSCVHADMTQSASTNCGSAGPCSFFSAVGGGTLTDMDARGYLLELSGFTAGNDKLIDDNGSGLTADGGIRCLIGGLVKYLLYADTAESS